MVDVDSAIKIWNYTSDLARHLYEVFKLKQEIEGKISNEKRMILIAVLIFIFLILNRMFFSLTNECNHLIEILTIIL